jgi:hypothetical protein
MGSKNITLRVDSELYGAYKIYCKKKDLKISQQFEIMMGETVEPEHKKRYIEEIKVNKFKKDYAGSLTGEPFMLHENKIVASMLLNEDSLDLIKRTVVQENSFGYRTVKSIPKRVNSIIKRIAKLDPLLLNKIANELSGDGRIVVLYSIYLRDRLFNEFLNEIIAEKFSIRDFNFDKRTIQKFISDKSDSERKIQEFTKETKLKLVNIIFNILKEAGLIVKYDQSFRLNNLLISSDLRNYYDNKGDPRFLKSVGALR